MAKIPDGILSGFRGKIGNIVGVKRHGEYYVRSQPNKINDKASPKQLQQRSRMQIVSPLAAKLHAFIQHTYGTIKPHRVRDPFLSVNLKSAVRVVNGINELDYEGLMVSSGALKNVAGPEAVRPEKNRVHLSWTDNSDKPMANKNDRVFILGLIKAGRHHETVFELNAAIRSDEEAVFPVGPAIERYPLHLYICTVNADGTMASNSEYLGEL